MSSLLTNNGAMVALQTLKSINSNMEKTQNKISTGLEVSSARDNAAVWSISKTMGAEVDGLRAVKDSLSFGQSVLGTARNASEQITDLLKGMRTKLIAAQTEGMDGATLQNDVVALREQISSIVATAGFNGVNLIDGSSRNAMQILASVSADAGGNTRANTIGVERLNLSVTGTAASQVRGLTAGRAGAFQDGGGTSAAVTAPGAPGNPVATTADDVTTFTASVQNVARGDTFSITLEDVELKAPDGGTAVGTRTFHYVANENDTATDVAKALQTQINSYFKSDANTDASGNPLYAVALTADAAGDLTQFTITSSGAAVFDAGLGHTTGGTPGGAGGDIGLEGLADIDVSTDPAAALERIDQWIKQATSAAASFGSAQGRIDTQMSFIAQLADNFQSGIGAMIDANMEEVAADLQSLQVQQQLATQSLSIANRAPQSILALFR